MGQRVRRWRRWGKWACTLAAALLVTAWSLSGWWWPAWICSFARYSWMVRVQSGELLVVRVSLNTPDSEPHPWPGYFMIFRNIESGLSRWWPTVGWSSGVEGSRAVPLWLPVAAALVGAGLLWHRDRRRPAGHCPRCGYDLTGIASGNCPECGVGRRAELWDCFGRTNGR